jgi:hypothetical protein
MADHPEDFIMETRIHPFYFCPHGAPKTIHLLQGISIGISARRQDTAVAKKQISHRRLGAPLLAPGYGMRADKRNFGRKEFFHLAHDTRLDAAHVADQTARFQRRQE